MTTADKAFDMGRQAADIATAENNDPRGHGAHALMSGHCLISARGRDDLIDGINSHLHELTQDPDAFYSDKLRDVQDQAGQNGMQLDNGLVEAVDACRDWLRTLKLSMTEQPKQVRAGIEAWIDEYAANLDLDPVTLTAR